ncbi:type II toxin-antitoxin system RelE/ParE family toxin [Roseateles sp. LKC17W]|uniref:Type II toxin-antitoxin system RelE/ParE family toxin n=1 Tax=Pelomonas margarita TaxID=3299031 RepID=A0ABW7FGU1_9BURK
MLPVILRALALEDVEQTLDHLFSEGAAEAAVSFIDALEVAQQQIASQPGIGSTRHAHELGIPGLRSWALGTHPYLLFYVQRDTHLDVWRVLHQRRDMAAWLTEPE